MSTQCGNPSRPVQTRVCVVVLCVCPIRLSSSLPLAVGSGRAQNSFFFFFALVGGVRFRGSVRGWTQLCAVRCGMQRAVAWPVGLETGRRGRRGRQPRSGTTFTCMYVPSLSLGKERDLFQV